MAFNFGPTTTADQAQQWLASMGLAGMPQDQVPGLLAQLMGSGQLSSKIGASVPEDMGQGWQTLTPAFDPSYPGGQYGQYIGRTGQGGPEVQFQPSERSAGFIGDNLETIGPLAVGGAMAFGSGLFSGLGGMGGGATDIGVNSAIAGGMEAPLSAGGMGAGGAALGAPISASAPSWTAAGGGGGGGVLSSLGGMGAVLPAVTALASGVGAASAPKSVTSSSEMPERVLPYANDLLSRAQTQSQQPFTPYGGPNPYQTTPEQLQGVAGVQDAISGFGANTAPATDYMKSVLAGSRNYTPGQIERASNGYLGQTTPGATNPYIGQTTAGISGPASVMGLAGKVDNPYIGKTSGLASTTTAQPAGKNALLGMDNPYLQNAIDRAMGDVSRQYSLTTAPQRQAQAIGSGSFGNTGVAQMQGEDQRQLASELGRVSSGMRMQDYGLQANLGEGQAGREQGANLWNAGAVNQGSQFNAGLGANDLSRQTSAYGQQGQFNAGSQLQAGMFDVTQGQGAKQFNAGLSQADLGRNAQLAGQQGQFNAGLYQSDLGRNANLAQGLSQFNSGVSGQDIGNQFNAWQGNNTLAMNTLNPTLNYANAPFAQNQTLFNMGTQNSQTGAAHGVFDYGQYTNQQQYPWQQLSNYGSAINTAAGRGGTTTTPLQTPNPWAAAVGGGLAGAQMYKLWNR